MLFHIIFEGFKKHYRGHCGIELNKPQFGCFVELENIQTNLVLKMPWKLVGKLYYTSQFYPLGIIEQNNSFFLHTSLSRA